MASLQACSTYSPQQYSANPKRKGTDISRPACFIVLSEEDLLPENLLAISLRMSERSPFDGTGISIRERLEEMKEKKCKI
jgi:hypothetical protein